MVIHSFNKHFPDARYFPGLMPGAEDREKERAWSSPQRAPEQVREMQKWITTAFVLGQTEAMLQRPGAGVMSQDPQKAWEKMRRGFPEG